MPAEYPDLLETPTGTEAPSQGTAWSSCQREACSASQGSTDWDCNPIRKCNVRFSMNKQAWIVTLQEPNVM